MSESLFMIKRLIFYIFLTFLESSEKIGQFIGQFKMSKMLVNTGGCERITVKFAFEKSGKVKCVYIIEFRYSLLVVYYDEKIRKRAKGYLGISSI